MTSAKAKKMYLVLKAGNDPNFAVPKGLTDEMEASSGNDVRFTAREKALNRRRRGREFAPVKSKEWIMKKKTYALLVVCLFLTENKQALPQESLIPVFIASFVDCQRIGWRRNQR